MIVHTNIFRFKLKKCLKSAGKSKNSKILENFEKIEIESGKDGKDDGHWKLSTSIVAS